ncbi:MAG: HDOD domain-containing protein [Desulfamplus sp.]|nr:HDOD domain-containing protein [Desulfamplus sp.]
MVKGDSIKNAQLMLKKLKEMKTLPSIATRLIKMLSDEKTTLEEFESVITMDPTLVIRLLKFVNSPFYALRTRVTSISEAVAFIGIDNLRNLIVVDALKNLFKNKNDEQYFSRKRLWMHCVAVAICSQMSMERIFGQKGEDAFLCGIVHDIGLIIADQVVPDEFLKVCMAWNPKDNKKITQYENEILHTDHTVIGHNITGDWKLPISVQNGVKQHHDILSSNEEENKSLPAIVQISDYLVARLNYSVLHQMKGELSPSLMIHIRDNIKEYKALTEDLPEELSKAEEIYSM